jgi:hypothetical protein
MKHALTLNLMIVAAVLLAIVISHSPVPLFALFMLRELPYGLLVSQAEPDDGEPRIGFTADV